MSTFKVVFCLNNDPYYIEQVKVALCSMSKNSPGLDVVVYLVNVGTFDFAGFDGRLDFVYKQFKNAQKEFMTGYSTKVMYEVLTTYRQPILWLDTDVIVRDKLSPIFDDVSPTTLKIVVRDNLEQNSVFNTGVVAVGYSEPTVKLLEDCYVNALNNQEWFADQLNLYKAYIKHKKHIQLVRMPWCWNDLGGRKNSFDKQSKIWHSKRAHFLKDPFRREYLFYLNLVGE